MRPYVMRRILLTLPVFLFASVLIFVVMRLLPGDVAVTALGEGARPQDVEALRKILGLDEPLHTQYLTWISHVIRGDLGNSFITHRSVVTEIQRAVGPTAELAVLTLLISILVGIPLGAVSAIRQNSIWDFASRMVAIGGFSVPIFWLGTMFLVITSLYFRWSPPLRYMNIFDNPWSNLQQVGIAAMVTSVWGIGMGARMTRSALLEVLRQDYIRTAWAKGLKERVVLMRHALQNAMIPVVTILGTMFAYLLGGFVVTEAIFSIPGLGRLLLTSLEWRDYPVVQGIILVTALIVVFVNLLVDISYGWLDPRVRYE